MAAQQDILEAIQADVSTEALSFDFREILALEPYLDDLALLPQLATLDLHGNAITTLPSDLSRLRHLRTLNIEENPLSALGQVLPGLKSLPMLRDLCINLKSVEDEEQIIKALPHLQTLNGTVLNVDGRVSPTKRNKSVQPTVSITQADLESVAIVYGATKNLKGDLTPEQDKQLTDFFDGHVQRVMKDLSEKLSRVHDPFLRQGEILMAKHELYEVCFHQVVQFAQTYSKDFGAVLRKLRAVHRELFHEFPGVLHDMRPHYLQRLSDMHAEVIRSEKESNMLLEAAEVLEKEAIAHTEEKERIQVQSDVARRKLTEENAMLKAKSERLEEEIARLRSCMDSESGFENLAIQSNSSPRHFTGGKAPPSPSKRIPRRAPGSSPQHRHKSGLGPSSSQTHSNNNSQQQQPNTQNAQVKLLPLKQLKEYIDQIYASKIKYDKKCHKAHLPRETMEQHMYTYLNQRYGLKRLIISHASSMLHAVQHHQNDNDVVVFGKILKNEIDEEYRFVQQQLKDTVQRLVRESLKSKHPLKSDSALDGLCAKKMNAGFVKEEEWMAMIKFMYNHADCLTLTSIMRQAALDGELNEKVQGRRSSASSSRSARLASPRESLNNGGGSKGGRPGMSVPFSAMQNILLEFQLASHENFIRKIRENFVKFDLDKNGILNEEDFLRFVKQIAPDKSSDEVDDLLQLVDPFDCKVITFSQVVKALSPELFEMVAQ